MVTRVSIATGFKAVVGRLTEGGVYSCEGGGAKGSPKIRNLEIRANGIQGGARPDFDLKVLGLLRPP